MTVQIINVEEKEKNVAVIEYQIVVEKGLSNIHGKLQYDKFNNRIINSEQVKHQIGEFAFKTLLSALRKHFA